MNRCILFIAAIVAGYSQGVIQADDRQDLQGLWVSLDEPWSVEFKGENAIFRGTNAFADSYQGRLVEVKLRYTLKPDAIPPEIDLNEEDFAAAKATHRVATFKNRLGIYLLLNPDELQLQFGSREHPEAFSYSEGAPSNHAWPLSRKLRRVSPAELQAAESLQGIWKGEVRIGDRVVFVDACSIRPGWILCLHGPKVRYRLYPGDGKLECVLHQYQVAKRQGGGLFGLGGSSTDYSWKPFVGSAIPEQSSMRVELNQITGIDPEKVEATLLHREGLPGNLRDQMPGKQAGITPLSFRLHKLSDDVALWGTSNQASENLKPPTEKQLHGEWRTVMGAVPKGEGPLHSQPVFNALPPEQWTFTSGNWRRKSEKEDVTLSAIHKQYAFWTLSNPNDPRQLHFPLSLKYEPVSQLLWATYAHRDANGNFEQRTYVLEPLQ